MKKLLLLLAAGATCGSAFAQSSLVFVDAPQVSKRGELPAGVNNEATRDMLAARRNATQQNANKGTTTGRRTYNYVELLITQTPTTADNGGFPYMWNPFNGISNYTSGYDTMNYSSLGQIIQPWYNKWNSVFAFPDQLAMSNDASYRLDTVIMYGSYQRNPNKPNVVDTMRFSFFYGSGPAGDNIESRVSAGPGSNAEEFGLDTMKYVRVPYDSVMYRARRGTSGAAIITKNVPLTFVWNDTLANGLEIVRVPVGMDVPAGNMVGMTAAFVTGDASFVPYDTVLLAGASNSVVSKYSMFRPWVFEQNVSAYPTYYPDNNYNNGLFKLNPLSGDPATTFRQWYFPQYWWTAPSTPEFPYVDFVISSNEWNGKVSVKNTNNIIGKVVAIPNPATSSVRIPVLLTDAADVTVTLTNAMGQTVRSLNLGKVAANASVDATFNVADLSSGIYFFTVDAAGQRATSRFTVAH